MKKRLLVFMTSFAVAVSGIGAPAQAEEVQIDYINIEEELLEDDYSQEVIVENLDEQEAELFLEAEATYTEDSPEESDGELILEEIFGDEESESPLYTEDGMQEEELFSEDESDVDEKEDVVVTSFEDLKTMIDEYTGTDTLALILAGDFVFDDIIMVPEGITVSLVPSNNASAVRLIRAGGYGGAFFQVNGTLLVIGTEQTQFELDGTCSAGAVEPFLQISDSGAVSLENAALKNNNVKNVSEKNGGAITNLGGVVLLSNTIIQGNTTDSGYADAIYSTNIIGLQNRIVADEIYLVSNDSSGNGSLYFLDGLTVESVVHVQCDSTLERSEFQIAYGEYRTDFSKVAAKMVYDNDAYYLAEGNDRNGLELKPSVFHEVIEEQFIRPTETTAEITVAVKTEKQLSSQTVMYYLIDETGTMNQPEYEQFQDFVYVDKNEQGVTVTLSGLTSFSRNQVIWYYFAEQSASGEKLLKDSILRKKVQAYRINIGSPVVSEVGTNGFKAEMITDSIAIGGICYYQWIDPKDIEGKNGQQVVNEYLKANGYKRSIASEKINISQSNNVVKNLTGGMRLYCYIEKVIDENTMLKSNIKISSLMTWTPVIVKYDTPYYVNNGQTDYDRVNLHLELAHCVGGEVLCEYIDKYNKVHEIKLGTVSKDSFDKVIPIRTVKEGDGSSFDVKSYSIYIRIQYDNNGRVYTKTSDSISQEIDPIPKDPGVSKANFVGLSSPYLSGAKVVFGVMGAGMDNYKPNKGDVRYYPYRWKAAKTPQTIEQVLAWVTSSGTPQGSFTQSSNGYFYGSTSKTTNVPAGSYPLTVVFKKQCFDGEQWVDTGKYAKLDKYFVIENLNTMLSTPVISKIVNMTIGIQITWGKVSGANKYRIFRKTSTTKWEKIGDTTSTTFIDTRTKSGMEYTYTIRCISEDGKTYTSNYDTTGKSILRLANTKVSVLANTAAGVKVAWNQVAGAAGYYVYRKTVSGSYARIATIKSGTTVTYEDKSTLTNGATYEYAVKAYNGSTQSTYTELSLIRLGRPTISSCSNSASGAVTVKWNANTKATGYQIQYVLGSTKKTVTIRNKANVSYVIKSLTKGQTYKVYVRSYRTSGGKNYYSAWSAAKSIKITR